jgi:predicted urease superfamily metal-dependent hydrolase
VSVVDLRDLVGLHFDTSIPAKCYHTLIKTRENYHPDYDTEVRMGIPAEPSLKPRAWFVYGANPFATRVITVRDSISSQLIDVEIAADTETEAVESLADWIKAKIGADPQQGSLGFPENPVPRKLPVRYLSNF